MRMNREPSRATRDQWCFSGVSEMSQDDKSGGELSKNQVLLLSTLRFTDMPVFLRPLHKVWDVECLVLSMYSVLHYSPPLFMLHYAQSGRTQQGSASCETWTWTRGRARGRALGTAPLPDGYVHRPPYPAQRG